MLKLSTSIPESFGDEFQGRMSLAFAETNVESFSYDKLKVAALPRKAGKDNGGATLKHLVDQGMSAELTKSRTPSCTRTIQLQHGFCNWSDANWIPFKHSLYTDVNSILI